MTILCLIIKYAVKVHHRGLVVTNSRSRGDSEEKSESSVEGYGGNTPYAGNVKKAARCETCAETFYDAF
jgi:hypothetical protein